VQWLLEVIKVDPTEADDDGMTPLFIACQMGHINIVTELLKHENVRKSINEKCGKLPTPFFQAKDEGHNKVVALLESKMVK